MTNVIHKQASALITEIAKRVVYGEISEKSARIIVLMGPDSSVMADKYYTFFSEEMARLTKLYGQGEYL